MGELLLTDHLGNRAVYSTIGVLLTTPRGDADKMGQFKLLFSNNQQVANSLSTALSGPANAANSIEQYNPNFSDDHSLEEWPESQGNTNRLKQKLSIFGLNVRKGQLLSFLVWTLVSLLTIYIIGLIGVNLNKNINGGLSHNSNTSVVNDTEYNASELPDTELGQSGPQQTASTNSESEWTLVGDEDETEEESSSDDTTTPNDDRSSPATNPTSTNVNPTTTNYGAANPASPTLTPSTNNTSSQTNNQPAVSSTNNTSDNKSTVVSEKVDPETGIKTVVTVIKQGDKTTTTTTTTTPETKTTESRGLTVVSE